MPSPTEPLFHWYVDCVYGKELVFALYTRPCRWGRCTFCSLPSLAAGGEVVTAQDIERQVDHVLGRYTPAQLAEVAKVSVYTASSTLDQDTLPTRSLMYLALKVCDLPSLKVVSLETRPEYVEDWELKALHNLFGPRVQLEVGIGYETHDPTLRNKVLGKGLGPGALERLLRLLGENGGALKAYLMLKPHWSLSEQGGVDEAVAGLEELATLGRTHAVPVSVHLNPTYMAKDCSLTREMQEHGYTPPELQSVLTVVREAASRSLPIYVGLDDEGLAVDGGTFRATGVDRTRVVKALSEYNRHQDLGRLLSEAGV